MKTVLLDLFTSKKFLAAVTAIAVYVAGRFGFNLDPAALDRIFAALLVYIGAQGIADVGKSAATVNAAADDARAARFGAIPPPGLEAGAALVKSAALIALVALGLAGSGSLACTPTQRTAAVHAVVNCVSASATAVGDLAASMRGECAPGGVTDWGCVRSKAVSAGLQIGGCAFLEVVSSPAKVSAATGEPPAERPGVAAFESYRASVAGGATFRTLRGDR